MKGGGLAMKQHDTIELKARECKTMSGRSVSTLNYILNNEDKLNKLKQQFTKLPKTKDYTTGKPILYSDLIYLGHTKLTNIFDILK